MMRLCVQVYCRTCQHCICAICFLNEHRTHKTVSVQTERQGKQVDQLLRSVLACPHLSSPVLTCLHPPVCPETGGEDGAGDREPDQGEGAPCGRDKEEAGGRAGLRVWSQL